MHDVRLVSVDDELERVAEDEYDDDAHQHRGHVKVPEKVTNLIISTLRKTRVKYGTAVESPSIINCPSLSLLTKLSSFSAS